MRASRLPPPRGWVAASSIVVALLAGGCQTSSLSPDAEVTIAGRLTRADGTPTAGVTVLLQKQPDVGEVFGGLMGSVATLGLACLARAVELCKDARKAESDSTGAYRFRLTGRDTQGSFNSASTMALSALLPGDATPGPAVQARFKVRHTEVTVPTLAFWDPADLAVRPDRSRVRVGWSDHPGSTGRPSPQYAVTAVTDNDDDASQGGDVVWVAEDVRPNMALDARAIGDLRGHLYVTATGRIEADGTEFTTRYDSQRTRLVGVLGPPPSRGGECAVAGPVDEPAPLVPCSLTDGAYGRSYRLQNCPRTEDRQPMPSPRSTGPVDGCRANTFVQVDLGGHRPVSAVFAHGLSVHSPVVIETSEDGIIWSRRIKGGQSPFLDAALPAGTHARYVRLSQADGRQISELAELAVW